MFSKNILSLKKTMKGALIYKGFILANLALIIFFLFMYFYSKNLGFLFVGSIPFFFLIYGILTNYLIKKRLESSNKPTRQDIPHSVLILFAICNLLSLNLSCGRLSPEKTKMIDSLTIILKDVENNIKLCAELPVEKYTKFISEMDTIFYQINEYVNKGKVPQHIIDSVVLHRQCLDSLRFFYSIHHRFLNEFEYTYSQISNLISDIKRNALPDDSIKKYFREETYLWEQNKKFFIAHLKNANTCMDNLTQKKDYLLSLIKENTSRI